MSSHRQTNPRRGPPAPCWRDTLLIALGGAQENFSQKKNRARGAVRVVCVDLHEAGLQSAVVFFARQQSYRKPVSNQCSAVVFFLGTQRRETSRSQVHLLSFRRFAPVLYIPYRHSRALDWLPLPIAAVSFPRVPPRGTATVPPVAATMRARHARTDPPPYTRCASRRFFCTFARPRLSYRARRALADPPFRSADHATLTCPVSHASRYLGASQVTAGSALPHLDGCPSLLNRVSGASATTCI